MLNARGDFLCVSRGRSSVHLRAQSVCRGSHLLRVAIVQAIVSRLHSKLLHLRRHLRRLDDGPSAGHLAVTLRGCATVLVYSAVELGRSFDKAKAPRKTQRGVTSFVSEHGPVAAARRAAQPRHDDRRLAASHAHRADGHFAGPAHADCDLVESLPPARASAVARSSPEHRTRSSERLARSPEHVARPPEHLTRPPKPRPGASR